MLRGEARVNGFVETFVIYSFEKINYTGSCLFRNRLLSCLDLFFFFFPYISNLHILFIITRHSICTYYMLKKSVYENIIAEDPVKSRAFFFLIFSQEYSSGYTLFTRLFTRIHLQTYIIMCNRTEF